MLIAPQPLRQGEMMATREDIIPQSTREVNSDVQLAQFCAPSYELYRESRNTVGQRIQPRMRILGHDSPTLATRHSGGEHDQAAIPSSALGQKQKSVQTTEQPRSDPCQPQRWASPLIPRRTVYRKCRTGETEIRGSPGGGSSVPGGVIPTPRPGRNR